MMLAFAGPLAKRNFFLQELSVNFCTERAKGKISFTLKLLQKSGIKSDTTDNQTIQTGHI